MNSRVFVFYLAIVYIRPLRTTRTYGPYVRAVRTGRTYGCVSAFKPNSYILNYVLYSIMYNIHGTLTAKTCIKRKSTGYGVYGYGGFGDSHRFFCVYGMGWVWRLKLNPPCTAAPPVYPVAIIHQTRGGDTAEFGEWEVPPWAVADPTGTCPQSPLIVSLNRHSRKCFLQWRKPRHIIRPHRRTTYVDYAYCYRWSTVVCRSVCHELKGDMQRFFTKLIKK